MEASEVDVFVGAAFLAILVVFGVSVVGLLAKIARTMEQALIFDTIRRADPGLFAYCVERYIDTRPASFRLEDFKGLLFMGFSQNSFARHALEDNRPKTTWEREQEPEHEHEPQFSDTDDQDHDSSDARPATSENGLDDESPHDS